MNTNDESGWDDLVEELGLKTDTPPASTKTEAPAAKPAARPAPKPVKVLPEPEPEGDNFGFGIPESAPRAKATLYDPGPEAVADDEDDECEDGAAESDEAAESQDGGKPKKRRRRRRKKKGDPTAANAPAADADGGLTEPEDSNVEQGEAPAEVEDDDDEGEPTHLAVDEELEEEAALPRPEWKVMTWVELVSKLYRPG